MIEDDEFLMTSKYTVPDSVMNELEVMDSAASKHICRDRAFEILYTDEDLGNIVMRNDEKMKVQGVGIICLKLHDGTIKKAFNMRYIPESSKINVLSLSVLASMRVQIRRTRAKFQGA